MVVEMLVRVESTVFTVGRNVRVAVRPLCPGLSMTPPSMRHPSDGVAIHTVSSTLYTGSGTLRVTEPSSNTECIKVREQLFSAPLCA
jgi:hypothetical protein